MFLRHNLPGIIWAITILALCGIPGDHLPDLSIWELLSFDKVAHAFVFALLVVFLLIGFKKQFTYPWLRYNAKKTALIFSISYGGLIELFQGTVFAGRTTDVIDFIANTLGCFLGLLLFRLIYGKELAK